MDKLLSWLNGYQAKCQCFKILFTNEFYVLFSANVYVFPSSSSPGWSWSFQFYDHRWWEDFPKQMTDTDVINPIYPQRVILCGFAAEPEQEKVCFASAEELSNWILMSIMRRFNYSSDLTRPTVSEWTFSQKLIWSGAKLLFYSLTPSKDRYWPECYQNWANYWFEYLSINIHSKFHLHTEFTSVKHRIMSKR